MSGVLAPALLVALGAAPWLWLGAAAAPIVVLYLMKRRYQERPVSSTLLWSRVLEDVFARSSFRRPAEWLSLLLLVAAVALAALAAADLRLGAGGGDRRALVLVIDASAGMGARDRDGGRRIDAAREGALEAIDGLRAGDVVAAVAAGAEPRMLLHATADRRRARAAVERLDVEPAAGRLADALALAAREARGLRTAAGPARVLVLSDFAIAPGALAEVDLEGSPVTLVRCGAPIENVGIVHAAVSGGGDGGPGRLLVRVAAGAGGDDAPRTRTVSLHRDGSLVDAREVTVAPGKEVAVAFEVFPNDGSGARYVARLEPADALEADDEVFVGVEANPPPRLLVVGEPDPFLGRLRDVFPGLETTRVAPGDAARLAEVARAASRPFDLAIVTAAPASDDPLPARRELWIGALPPGVGLAAGVEALDPIVVDWDRGDPLLRHVGFEGLLVVQARPLEPAAPDAAPEVLVRTTAGPQLVRVEERDRTVVAWASRLAESNLALVPAFPLLVRNLLGESLGGVDGEVHRAGEPLRIPAGLGRAAGTVDLEVSGPDGATQQARLWAREELIWSEGSAPGFYVARAVPVDGDDASVATRVFGRSLLSRDETVLAARDPDAADVAAGDVAVTPAARFVAERPVGRTLVLLALACLAVEVFVAAGVRLRARTTPAGRTSGRASAGAAAGSRA